MMLPRWMLVAAAAIPLIICQVGTEETTTTESVTHRQIDYTSTSKPDTKESFRRKLRNRGTVKYMSGLSQREPKPFQRQKEEDRLPRDDFRNQRRAPTQSSPTVTGEEMNLEETVLEVEKYLKSRPELPELSREEIVDYIHNISDSKKPASEEKEETAREMGDRSIMIVLPYKPEGEMDEELYTKSPLVRYLEAEDSDKGDDEEVTQEPKMFAYPVYRTTTEDIFTTTDATVRTYTNYNDAEMVTKRYYFEEPKYESTGSNHKYEESSTERVQGTIVVLPMKNHSYNTENSENAEESTTTVNPVTTTKPKSSTGTKSYYRKRVKTTTPKSVKVDFNQRDSLENFGFDDVPATPKPVKLRKGSKRKTTTTTTRTTTSTSERPPDADELTKVMEILPPDMKDLLSSLSLNDQRVIADTAKKIENSAPQPSIDPSSYSAFKPIPEGGKSEKIVDDEMKDFLSSFGLVPDDGVKPRRREKALQPEKDQKFIEEAPDVSLEIIPEDMRDVLHNLGLTKQSRAKQSRDHIFNPSNHSLNQSEEETEKLKDLMVTIKKIVSHNDSEPVSVELQKEVIQQIQDLNNLTLKYKNRQSTEINDEIKQIIITNKNKFNFVPLDNITENARGSKKFADGPDPAIFNEGEIKNEVKRQVSSSSSSSSSSSIGNGSSSNSSSSSGSGSSSDTTTEEPPNIEGLKASFGGGKTAPDDADVDSALPPKKPNGLYLLVDWNSFLEVGTDDDKRRVNIRFQPKVGDGRHFIPVTIP